MHSYLICAIWNSVSSSICLDVFEQLSFTVLADNRALQTMLLQVHLPVSQLASSGSWWFAGAAALFIFVGHNIPSSSDSPNSQGFRLELFTHVCTWRYVLILWKLMAADVGGPELHVCHHRTEQRPDALQIQSPVLLYERPVLVTSVLCHL